ncbi:FecCD family ABC transporter permease [Chengkuizengella sediminis]|uniref:FecCD family ABC transporter permease n=1 Tax=Chengkuizengella sediminis TaxID=1885917 RepID=UPI00138A4D9F|nr:iron ABC transporter permease [Chengkuizengella sediminis]NDI36038.1 iron ABC transporter permease [Chengkuizengella sediminis]
MKKMITIRTSNISFLLANKTMIVLINLLIIQIVLFWLSLSLGKTFDPLTSLKVLLGQGSMKDNLSIVQLRMPRVIIASLIGSALAVSGAILQGMIKNALASPNVIGISGGASVAAISYITLLPTASIQYLPLAAFAGALINGIIIYLLAWKDGISPIRLVLIGIGMSAVSTAMTTMMMIMGPPHVASKSMIWLTGSIYGASWTQVYTYLPWIVTFLPAGFILLRSLNVTQLGDDIAIGVGSPLQKQRIIFFLIAVALAGSAIAIGGTIAFVGLMAPHIARKLVGSTFGSVLPTSALLGSIIVMLADLIGRTAFQPISIPVGVFTSAIGAPFFIYLLLKKTR